MYVLLSNFLLIQFICHDTLLPSFSYLFLHRTCPLVSYIYVTTDEKYATAMYIVEELGIVVNILCFTLKYIVEQFGLCI